MTNAGKFIFVLGPHRSGSSLAAGALHVLGVNLGKQFIAENTDNPKGFFEDEAIVKFNDRLLRSMKLSWDSFGFIWQEDFDSPRLIPYYNAAASLVLERFSNERIAALKDPRFCILLPFWKRVVEAALDMEVGYLLTLRAPEHCIRSQKTRHLRDSDFHLLGMRDLQTLLLWWTYMYKALLSVDSSRLTIANYVSLIEDPEAELCRLARFLGLEVTDDQKQRFCVSLVDRRLNRSEQSPMIPTKNASPAWRNSQTLHDRLLPLSTRDRISAEDLRRALADLDVGELEPIYLRELQYMYGYSYKKILSLRHRLIQSIEETNLERSKFDELRAVHDSLEHRHALLEQRHERLNERLETILHSKGWRLITVLRRLLFWRK